MSSAQVEQPKAAQPQEQQYDILPTAFGAGYGAYQVRPNNFIFSFLAHTAAIALIVLAAQFGWKNAPPKIKQSVNLVNVELSDYVFKVGKDAGGGGGGGTKDVLKASKGVLPKASLEQITPPQADIKNPDPKLAVEQTVVMPPQPTLAGQIGDPKSGTTVVSNGIGAEGGIGSGSTGGVGSGIGGGVGPGMGGGTGGGIFRVGGGVSAPRPTYAPDPEYSEEARKAKYQGTVVLWVVIGPDGRPHDMRVQRSLGLGLDEEAMKAVKSWKFEPAKKDGKPVSVQVSIEVDFRLY